MTYVSYIYLTLRYGEQYMRSETSYNYTLFHIIYLLYTYLTYMTYITYFICLCLSSLIFQITHGTIRYGEQLI